MTDLERIVLAALAAGDHLTNRRGNWYLALAGTRVNPYLVGILLRQGYIVVSQREQLARLGKAGVEALKREANIEHQPA